MTQTAAQWTDCPDCDETTSVPPFTARPAVILNGTTHSPASNVSVCSACQAVVYGPVPK